MHSLLHSSALSDPSAHLSMLVHTHVPLSSLERESALVTSMHESALHGVLRSRTKITLPCIPVHSHDLSAHSCSLIIAREIVHSLMHSHDPKTLQSFHADQKCTLIIQVHSLHSSAITGSKCTCMTHVHSHDPSALSFILVHSLLCALSCILVHSHSKWILVHPSALSLSKALQIESLVCT